MSLTGNAGTTNGIRRSRPTIPTVGTSVTEGEVLKLLGFGGVQTLLDLILIQQTG
jgi:hypothetical protein